MATFSGQNGSLLYKKTDGKYYFSDATGQAENITPWNNISIDTPTFSPNGTRIAFQGSGNSASNVSYMNLDGSNRAFFGATSIRPMWSPDGLGLFYTQCSPASSCNLFRSNMGGSQTKSYGQMAPTGVSPNGQIAAQTSSGQSPSTIQTLSLTQPGATLYTSYSETAYDSLWCTSWSPDSQKIATWSKTTTYGQKKLRIINVSTGQIESSYDFTGFPYCPIWSPDATKIVFGANKNTTQAPDHAMIQISLPAGVETRLADDVLEVNDWQAISDQSTTSVYRFWSSTRSHHFYTASYDEAVSVMQKYSTDTWGYEATAFRVAPLTSGACPAGKSPVYRFWSDTYQGHFYTVSSAEKNQIVSKWPTIWHYEGVAFCGSTSKSGDFTQPVYRFWSSKFRGHFYTTSSDERDHITKTWPDTWKYEGTAYYVAN